MSNSRPTLDYPNSMCQSTIENSESIKSSKKLGFMRGGGLVMRHPVHLYEVKKDNINVFWSERWQERRHKRTFPCFRGRLSQWLLINVHFWVVGVCYLFQAVATVGSAGRNCELGQSCNRFTNGTAVLIKPFRLAAALCDLVLLWQTLRAIRLNTFNTLLITSLHFRKLSGPRKDCYYCVQQIFLSVRPLWKALRLQEFEI